MRSRSVVSVETLENRQLLYAPVLASALTASAGVTPAEIPQQVFNVKSYGAKGDGITDDKAAIQNAVNALEINEGGTLVFPTGVYRTSGAIQIEETNQFIITGDNSIIKPFNYVDRYSANGDILQITHCGQFTVIGMTFDGNKITRGQGFGAASMRIDGASDFRISRCTFIDTTMDDLYIAGVRGQNIGSHDGVIENSTFDGAHRNAISVIYAYNLEISNNHISNVTGMHPAAGVLLEANADHPDGAIHDILINQNTFENIGESGVSVVQRKSPKRITIDSNSFYDCSTGTLIRGEDCVITNNYYSGGVRTASGEGSNSIGQIAVTSYVGSTVTIDGNVIEDVTGMSGIYIHPTWNGKTYITNNTVSRVGKFVGISVWCNDPIITGNRVSNIGYIGIGTTGANPTISNNILSNGAHAAIYASGGGGKISRNTIINFGIAGAGHCILATGGLIGTTIESNVIRVSAGKQWKPISADTIDLQVNNSFQLLR